MEIIKRGAEAEIYRTEWRGRPVVIKRRVRKGYRIRELDDRIRKQRTKKEALLMMAARQAGVHVPVIYDVNLKNHEIVMQFVEGERVKDVMDEKDEEWQKRVCREIGAGVALLHGSGIVHGDITTSNMIVWQGHVHFIDFGLGTKGGDAEDMGVDLHLLMEAFKAAHRNPHLFGWVMKAYEKHFDEAGEVKKKVEEIACRGRYMKGEI